MSTPAKLSKADYVNHNLNMWRRNLNDLPPLELPAPYTLRTFRQGDEAGWGLLVNTAFNWIHDEPLAFDTTMRVEPAYHAKRVFFICDGDGTMVATAGAFEREATMPAAGMVHYVAVHPDHRGRQLGRLITLATLHRMVKDRLVAAWLTTQDFRLPAIRTYLGLGFVPLAAHASHRERWPIVFDALNRPDLKARFADELDGTLRELPPQTPRRMEAMPPASESIPPTAP